MTEKKPETEIAIYSRGYRAGKQSVKRLKSSLNDIRHREALWDRIYLTLLPIAMTATGWKVDDTPVTSQAQRIAMARMWTNAAVKERKLRMEP